MEKYLPLGSVVTLKTPAVRMMICGRNHKASAEKTYDYIGCLYPYGYENLNRVLMFNHDQIENIFYVGYQDALELKYRDEMLPK